MLRLAQPEKSGIANCDPLRDWAKEILSHVCFPSSALPTRHWFPWSAAFTTSKKCSLTATGRTKYIRLPERGILIPSTPVEGFPFLALRAVGDVDLLVR